MMRRTSFFSVAPVMLLLVLGAAPVAAQLTAGQDERARAGVSQPVETDITLPETFLEVEELLIETVEAALPQPPDLLLAAIAVPLPTETELRVSDALFDVPDPEQPGVRTVPGTGESSFFAEGVLGTGSNYHILGSLSLFKLGADPRFRFQFAHESIDGYQFKQPGSGYFQRGDTIEGWVVSSLTRRTEIEAEGRFHDREEGLQGIPTFYSAGNRYLSGSAALRFAAGDRFEIGVSGSGALSERILTVKEEDVDPPREDEALVNPQLWLALSLPRVSLRLDGGYEIRSFSGGELGTLHTLEASLGADAALGRSLFADASGGVFWAVDRDLLFPFRLGVNLNLDDALTLGVAGGYRVEPQRFFDLWQRTPMLDFSSLTDSEPAAERAWFGGAGAAWTTVERRLTLQASAEYAVRSRAVDLQPFDAAESRFPYRQVSLTTLSPQLGLTWRWRFLELGAGWQANLIERTVLDPVQSFEVSAQALHASERFGANISSRMDVFDEPVVPRLGAGGFFRITEGVQFVMELRDLLAPGMPDGRPQIGDSVSADYPFIEPGLRLIVKAQVSL